MNCLLSFRNKKCIRLFLFLRNKNGTIKRGIELKMSLILAKLGGKFRALIQMTCTLLFYKRLSSLKK